MKARLPLVFISVLSALFSVALEAQDRRQVRDETKVLVEKLKAAGEPADRCSLGADIRQRLVVASTTPESTLIPGDRLIRLGDRSVEGMDQEAFLSLLRSKGPDEQLQLVIDRAGELVDVSVQCVNARPLVEPIFNALTFASRSRFDECVSEINRLTRPTASEAFLRVQCASVSRRADDYDLAQFVITALDLLISEATHVVEMRQEVVTRLRNVERLITQKKGPGAFQALVLKTRQWPGGSTLYEDASPDWAMFRRNAESSLRSKLIDPDSARIEWTHGFLLGYWRPFLSRRIEGYWTCGLINARNRMGGYTGSTAFVVVLNPGGQVLYSEIGTAKDMDVLTSSCVNSARQLPPPPPELTGQPSTASSSQASVSIADEIKKLVELRDAGALSAEEFEAAKSKLLRPDRD